MSEEARLRWLCRRGMKELDVVMSRYLEQHYPTASDDDKARFRALLDLPDPELWALLLGTVPAPEPGLETLVQFLQQMSARD